MLGENSYGKSGIRLVRLVRHADHDELKDLTIAVRFEGAFEAAHASGDNSAILPTDTMKNTVYALAGERAFDEIESFGLRVSRHFLENTPAVTRVEITLSERPWERLVVRDKPHPFAFSRPGEERRMACVTRNRQTASVEAGLEGLTVLKSAHSAFVGFLKDRYTTLPEARDRIFATSVRATWRYRSPEVSFSGVASAVRQTLLEAFADHDSASVQHTLHAMGEAVLARHAEVEWIRLSLPNKHHLPVDLSPFGLENRNEVFVATEEPYGLIEATLRRG